VASAQLRAAAASSMSLARSPAARLALSPAASSPACRRRLRAARAAPASASVPHDAAARLPPAVTPDLRRGGTARNAAVATTASSSKLFVEEVACAEEAPAALCVLGLGQAMVRAMRGPWGDFCGAARRPAALLLLRPEHNPKSAFAILETRRARRAPALQRNAAALQRGVRCRAMPGESRRPRALLPVPPPGGWRQR
jgi:hypothetical protein